MEKELGFEGRKRWDSFDMAWGESDLVKVVNKKHYFRHLLWDNDLQFPTKPSLVTR